MDRDRARTADEDLTEVEETLREMGEPYAEPPNRLQGKIVGCERFDGKKLICRGGCDVIHQECPRSVTVENESVEKVIRKVIPCPRCFAKNTEIVDSTYKIWRCRQCSHEFKYDPHTKEYDSLLSKNDEDDENDGDDEDVEDDGRSLIDDCYIKGDTIVLEGEGFDDFKALQSRFKNTVAYWYEPEDDSWSISYEYSVAVKMIKEQGEL